MLKLSPRGPRYVIVTIGHIVLHDNTSAIKCNICGALCDGDTQEDQIQKLFECLGKHIPAEELYEYYEIESGRVVTEMNKSVWDNAKRRFKYTP